MGKSKVALRIAYLGTRYEGFQTQPGRRTVQAAIMEALQDARLLSSEAADFSASGRTDKGVHALDAVVAFQTEASVLATPRHINTKLPPDIWAWAHADVPPSFNARRDATKREYRYISCDKQFDIRSMRQASDMLCGMHDFRNFSRERKLPVVRTVFSSNVRISGNFVIIDVEADSFVWNMMRKLVTALILVGSGQKTLEWFVNMLNPQQYREGLRSAPAFGLVLTKVEYPDIHFLEDAYAKKRALRRIQDLSVRNSTMTEVLKTFDKQMTSDHKRRGLKLI